MDCFRGGSSRWVEVYLLLFYSSSFSFIFEMCGFLVFSRFILFYNTPT